MPDEPAPTQPKKKSGFRALPNDSTGKTLIVAFALCLVCSVLVSTASVVLRPLQVRNQELDRKANILGVAGLLRPGQSIDELFQQVEPKVVDLATGEYVGSIDAALYDQRLAAKDPDRSIEIPPGRDIAGIRRRAKYATAYLVEDGDKTKNLILPIHGAGLYSVLYGFLALESDGNTVFGLQYYEQGETPGLGGEVNNPNWRSKWEGKRLFDDEGTLQIEVIKGASGDFQVDALSGATLTSRGVTNMLHYWLGEDGFGPYLKQFRSQE